MYFRLVTAVMASAHVPALRVGDAGSAARVRALDGLRGIAAISVFVFHVVVYREFAATGVWEPPPSAFFALLGPLGVSLFFMITGFLFWRRQLSAGGRGGWVALYVGRLFRIAPMYLFVVAVMLTIVFARTDFVLHEPVRDVVGAVLQWLALGIGNLQPDVNGYRATHVLAGVTWTISYEWAFYASLLATAVIARSRGHLPVVSSALVLCIAGKTLLGSGLLGFAALFLSGMTVASLLHDNRRLRVSTRAGSAAALACLFLVFAGPMTGVAVSGYGTPVMIALGVFFYLVCSGATLFGLLTSRFAHRLGQVSYSVYLLQGIVLTLVFAMPSVRQFAMSGPVSYWLVAMLCTCLLVASASLTYRFVELPGIRLGKRIARHLADASRTSHDGNQKDSHVLAVASVSTAAT